MLALAALMMAAASSTPAPSPGLTSTAPWWEKFTFTMTQDGAQQGCQYATSLPITGAPGCGDDGDDVDSSNPGLRQASSSSGGSYTKITIERRFTPAVQPEPVKLETGDTLLGEQVLALAIDHTGAVKSCQIVGKAGEMKPPYGCDEARTEKFDTNALSDSQLRRGFMTIVVYGHEEYPV